MLYKQTFFSCSYRSLSWSLFSCGRHSFLRNPPMLMRAARPARAAPRARPWWAFCGTGRELVIFDRVMEWPLLRTEPPRPGPAFHDYFSIKQSACHLSVEQWDQSSHEGAETLGGSPGKPDKSYGNGWDMWGNTWNGLGHRSPWTN